MRVKVKNKSNLRIIAITCKSNHGCFVQLMAVTRCGQSLDLALEPVVPGIKNEQELAPVLHLNMAVEIVPSLDQLKTSRNAQLVLAPVSLMLHLHFNHETL